MVHGNTHPVKFEKYVHQDYPRLLHHASQDPVEVRDEDEEAELHKLGYRRTPSEAAKVPKSKSARD